MWKKQKIFSRWNKDQVSACQNIFDEEIWPHRLILYDIFEIKSGQVHPNEPILGKLCYDLKELEFQNSSVLL